MSYCLLWRNAILLWGSVFMQKTGSVIHHCNEYGKEILKKCLSTSPFVTLL